MDFNEFLDQLSKGHSIIDNKYFGHYDSVSIVQNYQSKNFHVGRSWDLDDGKSHKLGFYTSVVEKDEMMEFLKTVFRYGEYSSVLKAKNGFYFNKRANTELKEQRLLDYPGKAIITICLDPVEIAYTIILPIEIELLP